MNLKHLKSIILDYHEFIQKLEIVPREYHFEAQANYVLVGLRRSGKSTLLFKRIQELVRQGVGWEQIIYLNFEDERLLEFTKDDFSDILKLKSQWSDKKAYYFFDEIQNISGWERFARRMADTKESVYITGSNAQMLSKEIESRLGGRYLTKQIYPYNFSEYLSARSIEDLKADALTTSQSGRLLSVMDDFIRFGGFPESLIYDDKRSYVESIYQKIFLGDIIARRGIRNVPGLRLLVKKVAETVGQDVSFSKLFNTIRSIGLTISKDIVIDYLSYLEDAFLIFRIHNYTAKFVERETHPKYYFSDNGLLNLFLFEGDSALLENMVALALYQLYPHSLYYLKSAQTGIEIDFYLPDIETAIQVSYRLSETSREREIKSLLKLAETNPLLKRLWLVTHHQAETIEQAGVIIQVIPLDRFLLSLPGILAQSNDEVS